MLSKKPTNLTTTMLLAGIADSIYVCCKSPMEGRKFIAANESVNL